jgi:hypothetical protein
MIPRRLKPAAQLRVIESVGLEFMEVEVTRLAGTPGYRAANSSRRLWRVFR